jgi:hypothetical protein
MRISIERETPECGAASVTGAPDPVRVPATRTLTSQRAVAMAAFLAAVLPLGLAGCDSFHVTQQNVRVKVTYVASDSPAGGASVDFKAMYYEGWMKNLGEQERNEQWFARGMNDQCVVGTTGEASLLANVGIVRGGLFPEPFDPQQDRVTGQSYLFRVKCDGSSESLKVTMTPSAVGCGETFAVAVLSIGPAKDVTQEFTRRQRAPMPPNCAEK